MSATGMRVAVTGATGNVGSATLRALAADDRVEAIVGIARRRPPVSRPKVTWATADVARDALEPVLRGCDVVVHLAWLIQPSRDESVLHAVNVDGTRRVLEAAAAAGVKAIVVASSVGAYSEGPKDRAVDESWPTEGTPTSFYARHKAACERIMDAFAAAHPDIRLVRLRPGLIFQRSAGTEIRRLFAGPLLPSRLLHRTLIPIVPDTPRLVFQAVHADDVADAYRRAALEPGARGAYNIAADPVLDPPTLARVLGARRVPVPAAVLRAAAAASWRLRLQPTPEGWVDMGLAVPVMDTTRARAELGWAPTRGADDALLELLEGMRESADDDTPPLARSTSGPGRIREFLQGIGGRN
jgi:nucleoside-diphosphate-sugar epimerase